MLKFNLQSIENLFRHIRNVINKSCFPGPDSARYNDQEHSFMLIENMELQMFMLKFNLQSIDNLVRHIRNDVNKSCFSGPDAV
jgi:hypothetical protein